MGDNLGKTFELLRGVKEVYQNFGFLGLLDRIVYQFSRAIREWRLGIRTGEFEDGAFVADDGSYLGYEPIDYRCFDQFLNAMSLDPGKSIFLDYGCGKGRAVVLAALRPFKSVVGLERSAQMAEIARRNVANARKHFVCTNVEIIESDARDFEIDDATSHIFMFNPFHGSVLDEVLLRIRNSIARNPRQLKIGYVLPINSTNVLDKQDWLHNRQSIECGFWRGEVNALIYESKVPVQ